MSGNIIGQTLLNQFRIDAFVAAGGMGTVYRVWDLKRNVPLAMKVLHTDLAEDPSMLKKFQREARALERLSHPNIVPFYGLNRMPDFFFLLERFIDGPTLKDILRNKHGPLPSEEALSYFIALSAALGFAHHNGVVHCDVKPGNVMVDRGGNIYLTDFGIARHADSTVTTFAGAGTPAYMAPEQIREEIVTPASDVYALGIILYEMLTGVRPFRGDEPSLEKSGNTAGERIRYAQQYLKPPDPRRLNPAISPELAAVISKAMAKSGTERYHDATEMLEVVQTAVEAKNGQPLDQVNRNAYSSSLPASSAQEGLNKPTPVAKPAPKEVNKRAIVIGLFILIAALGAFAMNQFGSSPLPQNGTATKTIVETPTQMQTDDNPSLPISDSATDAATALPEVALNANSDWIAYTYGTNQDSTDVDPRYLAMKNVKTGEEQRLTFDDAGANFPSFSPTGDQIVYTGCKAGTCRLYVIQIESGKIEEIPSIHTMAMWPHWCPDRNKDLIAFEGRNGSERRIYTIARSTGKVTAITSGPFDIRPSWSPDCSKIAFLRDLNGQDDIYVYDFEEKREYAVLESSYDEFNVSWSPDGDQILFTRVSSDTNSDGVVNLDDLSDLILMSLDRREEISFSQGQYSVFSPSFSPDGKSIVFVAFNGSAQSQQIVVYSPGDDTFTPLTGNGPFNHTDWSP